MVEVLGEHVHRHVAAKDDSIVESAKIIVPAECALCQVVQLVDGGVTDLVGACLAQPRA